MRRAVIGLVLLAGCGSPPTLPDAEGRQIAEAFLADIRGGQADAAWADTGTDFKSYMGRDAFRAFVKATPALRGPAEFGDCKMTEVNGLRVAECTFKPKAGGLIRVDLSPADGRWRVERLAVEKG